MADRVMSIIIKAGGLSLRELFSRAGNELSTRLQLASLLKNGEVRIESAEGKSEATVLKELEIEPGQSEEEIAARLAVGVAGLIAENIEITPTVKGWRRA